MLLAAVSRGSAPACSGSTGSSTNSGWRRSSSGSTRAAIAVEKRPWKSIATSLAGPSAARAASTRATIAAVSAGESIAASRAAPFIFTAVMPDSSCAQIASVSSFGSSPPTQA